MTSNKELERIERYVWEKYVTGPRARLAGKWLDLLIEGGRTPKPEVRRKGPGKKLPKRKNRKRIR